MSWVSGKGWRVASIRLRSPKGEPGIWRPDKYCIASGVGPKPRSVAGSRITGPLGWAPTSAIFIIVERSLSIGEGGGGGAAWAGIAPKFACIPPNGFWMSLMMFWTGADDARRVMLKLMFPAGIIPPKLTVVPG